MQEDDDETAEHATNFSSSKEKYKEGVVGELSSKVLVDIYHVVIMELIIILLYSGKIK